MSALWLTLFISTFLAGGGVLLFVSFVKNGDVDALDQTSFAPLHDEVQHDA